jgi:hypothetical protein
MLQWRRGPTQSRDKFVWKWTRGAATVPGSFGDPRVSTHYAVCLFAGPTGALLSGGESIVPSDATRWSARASGGYVYRAAAEGPSGIRTMLLKPGAAERARILVKGGGAALADPLLPVALAGAPLRVQLIGLQSPTRCWESAFDAADVRVNDPRRLLAKRR